MRLTKAFLALVLGLLVVFTCSCNKNLTYAEAYEKIRVGMREEKIIKLMGEPTFDEYLGFNDTLEVYYKVDYWLSGATSKEDADKKIESKIPVIYYAVILESKDNYTKWTYRRAMSIDKDGNYYYDKTQSNKMTGLWNVQVPQ